MAQGAIWHAGQSQRALDHRLLERNQHDWSQIPIQTQYGNPGLCWPGNALSAIPGAAIQKNQLDVIRANSDPKQFITTNTMGWYDGFDHYVVEKDLDLASWDDYVGQGHLDPAETALPTT